MNVPSRIVILTLLSALASIVLCGCTPLAKTVHPVVWDEGLIGEWRFEFNPVPGANEDEQKEPPPVLHVTIAPKPDQRERPPHAPGEAAEIWPRYLLTIVAESEDPETVEIIGGILDSGKHRYFTFQQASRQVTGTVSILHTPLQHTLRLEHEGDAIRLWLHRVILVWTPAVYAGALQLNLPPYETEDSPRLLVQSFDDIIAYYDAAPEETWVLLGTAVRTHTAP